MASEIIIESARNLSFGDLKEYWQYRELLYFFVWRDLKARYKQTIFGAAWAILQPLLMTIIFTGVFSLIAKISTDDIPYPIFAYSALLPWTFFARSLERSSNCLIENSQLLTKVFFPRLLLPLSSVLSGLIDLAFAFLVLIGLEIYFGIAPTINIMFLPVFILLAAISALGIGLWLATLNVYFRDIKYITSFLIQAWMYATPIIYPITLVPEWLQPIYALNPMVGVIEGFRWAFLGSDYSIDVSVIISILISLILFFGGVIFFRHAEETFADIV